MTRDPARLIDEAEQHLIALELHLGRGELVDDTVFDAVCMRLSACIESLSRLDTGMLEDTAGDLWPAMWSVRNRIAHGYIRVDRTIIESTVTRDLGDVRDLISSLRMMLDT